MIVTSMERRFAVVIPPNGASARPSTVGSAASLAKVPVLVIEDEAMIAWMLQSLLEDMGFELIDLASTAAEAATAAARRMPGLVVSDINLGPGADGIDAVGDLCSACNPAVVFVSAYIDERARTRIAQNVTGARILSKPLTSDALSAVIWDALRLKRAN